MFNRTKVKIKQNKLITRTTGLLFITLFATIGLVLLLNSRAAVSPTNVGFETANDPKCTGGINTTAGNTSFTQDNTRAYEGTYSAKASFTGGSENAYARCVVTTSWITGDEVWYGAAFFLPSGFSQSMQNQVDLMRWDNFSLNNASQDWGGIIIQNSDKQARLKRFNASGDYTDISTPFTFPENRWVWLEVHQKFSPTDGQAINEVYIDGSLQSSSTKANTYGREVTRIRYGLVAIGAGSQTNPLNLWVDRAAISATKISPAGNTTPVGEKANLWIDQNGGNCVRSETPIAYQGDGDINSCSSVDANPTQGAFNKAYKAAKPADLVLIKQGTYTTQEINSKAGATTPNIIIQSETGATVKVKELDIQSASYLTFKNFTVIPAKPDAKPDGSGGEAPYNQILDFGTETGQTTGAHHVTLDGVNVDGRQPDGTPSNRDASGINGNTAYITIKNADFGFIRGRKVMIIQNYGAKGPNDHLELDNVKLHDDPQWPDGGNHLECLWLSSTTNSLFNRLHLYNCALPMILSTFGDDLPSRTTTIQNSIFEASQGYGGNPGYFSIDGCLGRPSAGIVGSLTLKYNYFAIPFGCADGTASSGLKLVGNIGSANSCLSGASYSHNIWSGAKCDNTDVQNSTISNSANYMKMANPFVNQPGDYRPSSGNSLQVNSGDPAVYSVSDWRAYPAIDASGNIRPIGGIPDVGPFEYTGTTPTPTPKLPGDVDGNKVVDIDDLSLLLINWKKNYPQADFVKDNIIDIDDLSILLINWGMKLP